MPADFRVRFEQAALEFVTFYKRRLLEQGLERVSEAGLRAFFFSAIYEALRFDTGAERAEGRVEGAVESGRRRSRLKRRGAAYFTPPALAYFAAHRALTAYFDQENCDDDSDKCSLPLPVICDPAMGTGLYLVAALDYLSVERPAVSRAVLAGQCLFGVDFDASTCSAAKSCLTVAAGGNPAAFETNIVWADALMAELPTADIVLSNPPWDIVKATKANSARRVPHRVNKARIASLRGNFIHQSEGDTSYYKLFLERTYQILKPGGVAAVLTPAAFCSDKGAGQLRALFMDRCNWLSLDGFINEDNAFAIHPHFKYLLLCFVKASRTQSIKLHWSGGKQKQADSNAVE